jgi:AraC family transcriptional regulator of adaptative response/methylated-DNA-[protein]-cysteine methyltransferase
VAGKTVREIYCWDVKIEALNIYLASTKTGALRIGLTLKRKSDSMNFFRKIFPEDALYKDYSPNRFLIQAVKAALLNKRPKTILDLDTFLTPFQQRVYEAITKIPYGRTRTYGEVALMVGNPTGARAVGQAMGRNPLPLIFP